MTEIGKPYVSPYAKLFDNHPWLPYFLVNVVKRILGIIIEFIDKEAKPHLRK